MNLFLGRVKQHKFLNRIIKLRLSFRIWSGSLKVIKEKCLKKHYYFDFWCDGFGWSSR